MVYLEIARVDDDALRRIERYAHGVRYGVADAEEARGEGVPQRDSLAGADGVQPRFAQQSALAQLHRYQLGGEAGRVNGDVHLAQQIRQSADVVFVSVRYQNGAKPVAVFAQIRKVGDGEVHARHVLFREHYAGVNCDAVIAALQNHHVAAYFAEAAERNRAERIVVCHAR